MIKSIILLLFSNLFFYNLSAQSKGINFDRGSWNEVLIKAKKEKKAIFIDYYASWCAPCKKMDLEVFSDSLVGNFMNSRFISVRMQIDSTDADDEYTRSWYKTAKMLQIKYPLRGVPTFLFFSSNGELLYRDLGFKNSKEFVALANNALDTSMQYSRKIAAYNEGHYSYNDLPDLIALADKFGDEILYHKIWLIYKKNYLDRLGKKDLLNNKNVAFMLSNLELINSKDRFFHYCYFHPKLIDKKFNERVKFLIDLVIVREEITDKLWNDGKPLTNTPNWENIKLSIQKKFNKSYADRLVEPQKIKFFKDIGNWKEYAVLVEHEIAINPPRIHNLDDSWKLNDHAWVVFKSCMDTSVLSKGLEWSNWSIRNIGDSVSDVHNFYDTKANLLYKLGRKQEAILCEEKAILISSFVNSWLNNEYKVTINKMGRGVPTWK